MRGLQAEMVTPQQLRWQVLVMQSARNPAEFNGRLELVLAGTQGGKPWTQTLPAGRRRWHCASTGAWTAWSTCRRRSW